MPPLMKSSVTKNHVRKGVANSKSIDQSNAFDTNFTHFPPLEAAHEALVSSPLPSGSPRPSDSDHELASLFDDYRYMDSRPTTVLSDSSDIGSSLDSWGEDEFDREAARRVSAMFAEIDACLYDDLPLADTQMQAECNDWKRKFPHLRIVGKAYTYCSRFPRRRAGEERSPSVLLSSRTEKQFRRDIQKSKKQTRRAPRKKVKLKKHAKRCTDKQPLSASRNEELIACHFDSEEEKEERNSDSDTESSDIDELADRVADKLILKTLNGEDSLNKLRHDSTQSEMNHIVQKPSKQKRHSDPNPRPMIRNLTTNSNLKKLEFAKDDIIITSGNITKHRTAISHSTSTPRKADKSNTSRRIISAPQKFGRLKPLPSDVVTPTNVTSTPRKSRRVEFSAASRLPPISARSRTSTRGSTGKSLRSVSSYSLDSRSPSKSRSWINQDNISLNSRNSKISTATKGDTFNGRIRNDIVNPKYKPPSKRIQAQTISSAARMRTPNAIKHNITHINNNNSNNPFRV